MPLSIASLNSGSNGNCCYIGNDQEAVLIDAGISCIETERRMEKIGRSMETVKAIFITHEHTDHIAGMKTLSKKYKLPVFISPGTLANCPAKPESSLVHSFQAHQKIRIGDLSVTGFPKYHDANDPYSFVVSGEGVHAGIMTDIGWMCEHVIHYFKQCQVVFLEANYDEDMLLKGAYPAHLKKRIHGKRGHFSNRQALELFKKYRNPGLQNLLLSHLSEQNNTPETVMNLFHAHAGSVDVRVASRYRASELLKIENAGTAQPLYGRVKQLSLEYE